MIKPLDEFQFLSSALEMYRDFWCKAWEGHKEKRICHFDGTVDDLDMLDYCEYELGHPDETYKSASIIWGNIIQKNSNLSWGISADRYHLFTRDDGYKSFSIDVHSFVTEIKTSQISQFCSFSIATEKVLLDLLGSNCSIDELSSLQSIVVSGVESGNDSYSTGIAYTAGMVFRKSPEHISSLHGHIDLGRGE